VKKLVSQTNSTGIARTEVINGPKGEAVQVGFSRMRDAAGLDWTIAVAVPRSDFLARITESVQYTMLFALVAATLIVAVGFSVLSVVARELGKLSKLAQNVGTGVVVSPTSLDRKDEIGELARSFADMQHRLMTDRLTGVANREALLRRIEEKLFNRRRNSDSSPFALLFVDVDHFKNINDQYGHPAGDQVLQEFGRRLRTPVRESDLVVRYAGDEFVVLLDSIDNRALAERVRSNLERALDAPFAITSTDGPTLVKVSASFGLACYPEDGLDAASLLKAADSKMYSSKKDHHKTMNLDSIGSHENDG
jgi:diguanylate cyclase (GGDEF)-like protein